MSNIRTARECAFVKQRGGCIYCGAPMWLRSPDELRDRGLKGPIARILQCTAEHLRAKRNGGADARNNIAAACLLCNRRRHQRKVAPEPAQYRALVQKRIAQGRWHPREILRLTPRNTDSGEIYDV